MKTKTQRDSVTPEPVERPAEEAAALALKTKVAAFNADAMTRTSLTDADRDALDEIESLGGAYAEQARRAWHQNAAWGPHTGPQVCESIAFSIGEYSARCKSTILVELQYAEADTGATDKVPVPAIESSTVRGIIFRKGEEIAAAIDAAIAAGYNRIGATDRAKREMRSRVEYWLQNASVRALVGAYVAIIDDPIVSPLLMPAKGILDALRQVQQAYGAGDIEGVPDALFVHRADQWIGTAREILAETQQVAAA